MSSSIITDGDDDKKKSERLACIMCNSNEVDDVNYGQLKEIQTKNGRIIAAHNFCLLFSCNLKQRGDDDNGLHGFLPEDIIEERRRGGSLKCHFCHKKGATSACCNASCKTAYHYTCAINAGASERPQFRFCDLYTSFCRKHEQVVKIRIGKQKSQCIVCTRNIGIEAYRNNSLIQCDCCDQLFHVSCMKQYAKTAGRAHFKCVNCNCSDLGEDATDKSKKCKNGFVRKCNIQGVFVPEKDADWEYGDAFADHYKDYDQCDAEECLCPHGRKHDIWVKCEKWYIVLCNTCGSSGMHRHCGRIKGEDVEDWHCSTCAAVFEKSTSTSNNVDVQSIASNTSTVTLSSSSPTSSIKSTSSQESVSTGYRPGPSSWKLLNGGGDAAAGNNDVDASKIKRPRTGSTSSSSNKHLRTEQDL